jgi:hypothetical protein
LSIATVSYPQSLAFASKKDIVDAYFRHSSLIETLPHFFFQSRGAGFDLGSLWWRLISALGFYASFHQCGSRRCLAAKGLCCIGFDLFGPIQDIVTSTL